MQLFEMYNLLLFHSEYQTCYFPDCIGNLFDVIA